MSKMRIVVDQSAWTVDESDAQEVSQLIQEAMRSGTVAALSVLDSDNRPVTLFLNGKTATAVTVDLDQDPRPSEFSG